MKIFRIVPCLIYFFASHYVFAQNPVQEVYQLKNGSLIKASFIEQILGETVKLRSVDGSIFVLKEKKAENTTNQHNSLEQQTKSASLRNVLPFDLGFQFGVYKQFDDDFDRLYGAGFAGKADLIFKNKYDAKFMLTFIYSENNGDPVPEGIFFGARGDANVKIFHVLTGLKYNIPVRWAGITPYVKGFIGLIHAREKLSFAFGSIPAQIEYNGNGFAYGGSIGLQRRAGNSFLLFGEFTMIGADVNPNYKSDVPP